MRNSVTFLTLLLLLGCSPVGQESGPVSFPDDGGGNPLVEVDGKVRFFVKTSDDIELVGRNILVNTVPYEVKDDGNGHPCIDVYVSPFNEYFAAFSMDEASPWHGDTLYDGLIVPNGQSYSDGGHLPGLPVFASYSESSGDVLLFDVPYAVVEVVVKGETRVSSVRLSSSRAVSGRFNHRMNSLSDPVTSGLPYITLNCTENGDCVPLSSSGTVFRFAVIPGEYLEGMDVTVVSQDHKAVFAHIPGPFSAASGQTVTHPVDFTAGDNLFYEGFDTFVWGSDIMGGAEVPAFVPELPDGASVLTGTEYALLPAEYPQSGSDCQVAPEYTAARAVSDYADFDYIVEYQGFVVVTSENGKSRGAVGTPAVGTDFYGDLLLEYDFCHLPGSDVPVAVSVLGAGCITSCAVNGGPVVLSDDNFDRIAPGGTLTHAASSVTVPSSMAQKKSWNHVSVTVTGASSVTSFRFAAEGHGAGQGFCLDNIRATRTADRKTVPDGSTRLLYWNILSGMDADSPDHAGFGSWVKSYSPDICVWCEAMSADGVILQKAVAESYGHSQTSATGSRYAGSADKFPQQVTSVWPLEHVLDVPSVTDDGMGVTHGGGLVKVRCADREIGIVPLHLRPRGNTDNDAVNDIQYRELEHILKYTLLNPEYADIKEWIVLGDFNSHSPSDAWRYELDGTTLVRMKAHEYIRSMTDLVDVFGMSGNGCFFPTLSWNSRIDYIYMSPSLADDIVRADVVADSWCSPSEGDWPSDHRPLMIDFKIL